MAKTTVLTYAGEEWAAGRLVGSEAPDGRYIGWGTGAGTAAKGDAALFTEEDEARATGLVELIGTGVTAKYQVTGTLTANDTKEITNAGNFTADASGDLIVHTSFDAVIPLEVNDQITFIFTIDPS